MWEFMILGFEKAGQFMSSLRRPGTDQAEAPPALLCCSVAAEDERRLKQAPAVGSHLDCNVLTFIQAREIARQACQRLGCFYLSFTLSWKLQPFLVGIEPGAVPDVEIIARHRITL